MNMYESYFWGMHVFWWIFWVALIIIAVFTFRGRPKEMPGDASPLEILQRRYVNGEISKEEYEEKKRVLKEEEMNV
jgi:putative membrane protein